MVHSLSGTVREPQAETARSVVAHEAARTLGDPQLWYGEPNAVSDAIGYAKFRSRSHDAVIRVYDEAGTADC